MSSKEWECKARSSIGGAWYNVDDVLSDRYNYAGDLEVCVRFHGLPCEYCEWVNINTAFQARSIPLESSDCPMVAIGDKVLCFLKSICREPYYKVHAKEFLLHKSLCREAYYEAHVKKEIQRKEHDHGVCKCLFLVKFDVNQVEKTIGIEDLCRIVHGPHGRSDSGVGSSSRVQEDGVDSSSSDLIVVGLNVAGPDVGSTIVELTVVGPNVGSSCASSSSRGREDGVGSSGGGQEDL